MSGALRHAADILSSLLLPRQDSDGVVHQDVHDLVRSNPLGESAVVRGNRIIVGAGFEIRDERPEALELNDGQPIRRGVLEPTRILPRNKNRYNHRELERERVRASLAKEHKK